MFRQLVALGHRMTRVIAPFITPERVLILLLAGTLAVAGVKLYGANQHTCLVPLPIKCPEVVECIETECPECPECLPVAPTCPTEDRELVHPHDKCHWVVHCEEE